MTPTPNRDREMPFLAHLAELRRRLVRSFIIIGIGAIIALFMAPTLFGWLAAPLLPHLPPGSKLIALSLTEGWVVYFQLAAIAGTFLTSPLWLYQLWAFLAPGLIKQEHRLLFWLGLSSAACFIAGGAFCYGVIMPYGYGFLVRLLADSGITLLPQMQLYLSLALQLILAFGLVFELPIVVVMLVRWDIVSIATLKQHRRHMIVVAFIVGAVLTPTVDIVNQTLLALPLILLYEVGLFAARFQKN